MRARLDAHDARAQRRGHVLVHGGGDEHLLVAADEVGQARAAIGVEFGEHVVEDEHRVAQPGLGAQQLGRGEPQRERERPRFAVGRVALDRQAADAQHEVVAVRTDEGEAAIELGRRGARRAPARNRSGDAAVGAAIRRRLGVRGALFGIAAAHRERPLELAAVVGAGDRGVRGGERRAASSAARRERAPR